MSFDSQIKVKATIILSYNTFKFKPWNIFFKFMLGLLWLPLVSLKMVVYIQLLFFHVILTDADWQWDFSWASSSLTDFSLHRNIVKSTMVEYKGIRSINSRISGLTLMFGFPKTNLYSILEILLYAHTLDFGGVISEVVYFNLPYIENKNLRERGKTWWLSHYDFIIFLSFIPNLICDYF